VEILANFAPEIAKLVEITLQKHTFPKFPRFLGQKSENLLQNELARQANFAALKSLKKGCIAKP